MYAIVRASPIQIRSFSFK